MIAAGLVLAACASIVLSLPGSRVGLEIFVPPSLSCLPLVALGQGSGVRADC